MQTSSLSAVAALVLLASSAAAQQQTILDSYKRAYDLLEAAGAAHGGAEAMDTRGYPGGFYYTNRRATNDNEGLMVDARTVEIHDIGPTPHAEEMLVAWVPSEGVLFHADVIEAAAGKALPGSASPTTVRLAEFIRQKGWNVRVFGGAHGFLDDPSQFATLVGMPVIPPL